MEEDTKDGGKMENNMGKEFITRMVKEKLGIGIAANWIIKLFKISWTNNHEAPMKFMIKNLIFLS
jgi:hypothetical protein